MVEALTKNVESLEYTQLPGDIPQNQKQREYDLQNRAGIPNTNNFEGVRTSLAAKQESEELFDLYAGTEDAIRQGASAVSAAELVGRYRPLITAEDSRSSLEGAAAEAEIEEALQYNPQLIANVLNDPANVDLKERMTKSEQMETFLQAIEDYATTGNKWTNPEYTGAFAARGLMPIIGAQSLDQEVVAAGKETPLELSSVTTTKRQQAFYDNAAKTMTVTDFQKFLDSELARLTSGSYDKATLEDFVTRMRTDANNTNDLFGLFEIGTPLLRAVNNSTKAAKSVGNVAKAKSLIIKDRAQFLEEAAGPSAFKPMQTSNSITYSTKVAEEMADTLADERAVSIIHDFEVRGVLTDEEINTFRDLTKFDIKAKLNKAGNDPVDVVVDVVEGESGELQTAITFGTGIKGDAAMNQAAAYNYGKRLGFADGDFDIYMGDGEGWYVRTIQPLVDRNLSVVGDKEAIKDWSVTFHNKYLKSLESPLNWLQKHWAGSTGMSKEAHARDVQATRKMTAARNMMHDVYTKQYHSLSKGEKNTLKEIYIKGQHANDNAGKWFTPEELDDLGATEKMKEAYYSFKKVSDIDYISNNDALVRRLNREGWKMATVKGEDLIAKEVSFDTIEKNFNNMIIHVDGKNLSNASTTVEELMNTYKDSGYKLIQINRRSNLYKDLNYTHMLVKDTELNIGNLPRFITNYAPGGRRAYTFGTMYVKVGRALAADGKLMNGWARTLVAGLDKAKMQKYVDECNTAIDIANRALEEGLDGARVDRLITDANFKEFKVANWEDLKKLIRTEENPTGIIDPRYKAQLLEDGQKYINPNNGLASVIDDAYDIDSALSDLVDMRGNYSGHRGQILDGINGDKASILSLNEVFDRSVNKAAYGLAISDLHEWYAREFVKNFSQVLDVPPTAVSRQDILRYARVKTTEEVPEEFRQMSRAAEHFKKHYERVANARTEWDKKIDNVMHRTAEMLDAYVPGIDRGGDIYKTISKTDPAKAARALGFHAAMSWWNPAQLVKQGLGVINTVGMSPINGTRAMLSYPLFRLAHAFNNNSKLVNAFADACVKLVGISHEDFHNILKYMKEYGSWESSRMLVGLDAKHIAFLNRNKVAQSMMFFMKEGNDANYVIADVAAYLSKKGSSFKEIAAYSDDLFLNMTRASESAFQAGQYLPTSIMAQWLGYPMRLMEAVAANNRLTKSQRLGIVGAQLAAWGIGGTFLDDESALNFYRFMVDSGVSPYWAGVLTNGTITNYAKERGIQIDEGLHLQELAKRELLLWDFKKGEIKLPSIPAGQAVTQIGAIYKAVQEAVAPECGEYDLYNYMKTLATEKGLPSGPRNLAKAFVAWRTNQFYDTHKDVLKQNVKDFQVWSQAFGFGPTEQQESSYLYEAINNVDELVQELYEEQEVLQQAIINYKESIGYSDKQERDEEFARISARHQEMYKAHIKMLEDAFPDGRAKTEYTNKVIKNWEDNVSIENKRQKAYEKAGENWLRYIQELMNRSKE